jgi:hypothetical protein
LPRKAKKQKFRGVVDTNVLVAGISGFRKPYVRGENTSADVLYKWAEKGNFVGSHFQVERILPRGAVVRGRANHCGVVIAP